MVSRKLAYILITGILCSAGSSDAQETSPEIDSLLKLLPVAGKEERVDVLHQLAGAYYRADPSMIILYAQTGLDESIALKDINAQFKFYNHLGVGNAMLSNYDTSIYYFNEAVRIGKENKNPRQYAAALDNLSNVYMFLSEYELALEKKQEALRIHEAMQNTDGILVSLINIANIHTVMESHDKAITTYLEAIERSRGTTNERSLLSAYQNVASSYHTLGKDDTARIYLDTVFVMEEKLGLSGTSEIVFDILAGISENNGDYDSSIYYFEKELALLENTGRREELSQVYISMGEVYIKLEQYDKAEFYLKKGLDIAREINLRFRVYQVMQGLAEVYHRSGRYKEAAEFYEMHINLKDSVLNENTRRQVAEMESRFKEEKIQLENQNLKKQQALNELTIANNEAIADKEKQQKQLYATGLILAGILVIAVLIGFVQKKRDNAIIQVQKKEVELRNKEIFDSINYAKRIQDAILPPQQFIDQLLPENFVLYKPKDIVAGDFYWIEQSGDLIILAVADCTGHGVPGAMVSVVCHNALNRSVREFGLHAPEKILDKTRELVLETFARSEKNVNDGMDIALCTIDTKTRELKFAGANNDLLLLRNNQLTEVPADKQPVGKFDRAQPFNAQTIQLQKTDIIYLFTDGYADQFGGEKGKKMKKQSFQKLVHSFAHLPMKEQENELSNAFETWRQGFDQLDDVCLIGFSV
jgi:serine phosphatase RsbU (regulator of sigma subunit)